MSTTSDRAGFALVPDTSFSLEAAAGFGFGPNTGRPKPEGGVLRLAFVADDLRRQVGVLVTQDDDGTVHGELAGRPTAGPGSTGDAVGRAGTNSTGTDGMGTDGGSTDGGGTAGSLNDVRAQVARILCLDQAGKEWLAVGGRDPVLGELQAALPGLRPVLFHSPYEAAAWSIIAQRRHRTQAAALRTRLSQAHGATFELGGESVAAFPLPAQLLRIESFPGLDPTRIARLHGVARAALDGRLDAGRLRTMPGAQALRELQTLPGLGPTYSTLILLRATGATDVMTYDEPRIPAYAAHFYGLGHPSATRGELERLAEGWRPFRTWACVLLRVAGDRAGIPAGPEHPR